MLFVSSPTRYIRMASLNLQWIEGLVDICLHQFLFLHLRTFSIFMDNAWGYPFPVIHVINMYPQLLASGTFTVVEKFLVAKHFVWSYDKNWLLCLLLIKGLFRCPFMDVVVEVLCELKRNQYTLGVFVVLESLYPRLKAVRVETYSWKCPIPHHQILQPWPHVAL